MKKLGKLKLKTASVMNDTEMKSIFGGSSTACLANAAVCDTWCTLPGGATGRCTYETLQVLPYFMRTDCYCTSSSPPGTVHEDWWRENHP